MPREVVCVCVYVCVCWGEGQTVDLWKLLSTDPIQGVFPEELYTDKKKILPFVLRWSFCCFMNEIGCIVTV